MASSINTGTTLPPVSSAPAVAEAAPAPPEAAPTPAADPTPSDTTQLSSDAKGSEAVAAGPNFAAWSPVPHPQAPGADLQAEKSQPAEPASPGQATSAAAKTPEAPLTPAMQKALDRAHKRFDGIEGSRVSVTSSPESGGRPVITVRNKDADPQHLTVQTHFHGWQQYDKDPKVNYEANIGKTVGRAWDKDKNRVFVLPESNDEGWGKHVDWSNIHNVEGLTEKAVKGAGLPWDGVEQNIISGHSAGGKPVTLALNRAQAGKDGPFTRVELYDAIQSDHSAPVDPNYMREHRDEMLYVPGVMPTPWQQPGGIPRSQQTRGYRDHWSPLWDSLGQVRAPELR